MTTTIAPPRRGPRRGTAGIVERLSAVLDSRTSRRGFLARTAVVGSALAVGPGRFLLRPGTAYAAVCGTDSACSSGYTVFCATVNNGVNRCPPNALVGGWWKADNSGFCCGSARYYIDCHSYCSCGCGGGNHFCGEGCRSCSCGCGPNESCDQRRVCCNNFRYGQCRQDVSCTGPVWCRVVSCTPPWRVPQWACTTTSATDNRTGSHTAPGLPYCTGIDAHYTALGGAGSVLGEPVTGEVAGVGGAHTLYDRGAIYWSAGTGAHEVHGAILGAYLAVGADRGPLGYPVTDELPTLDGRGRVNTFRGPGGDGTIMYRADLGAYAAWGEIRARWAALGGERGVLGYPTTSEQPARDGIGRFNDFVGPGGVGSIYWTPTTHAHAVWGAIRGAWAALDRERGPLGYPTSEEQVSPDGVGRFTTFLGYGGVGSVHWSPATGAHPVWGAIRQLWRATGGESGPLGYPVSTERPTVGGGGTITDFVGPGTPASPGASVVWSLATGAHSVRGPVRAAWLSVGGTGGRLGLPTAEPVAAGAGRQRAAFQHGSILLDTATGATTITYT